jgi:hypothetical protein
MAEPKTRPTKVSVKAFLDGVKHPGRRKDAHEVDRLMRRLSGEKPVMWGPNIVGYGTHDWVTADGQATPWPIAAFSPRSTALVVYLMPAFPSRDALLSKLGKHSIGKSCLYIKRLEDVDGPTLEALVKGSMKARKASG